MLLGLLISQYLFFAPANGSRESLFFRDSTEFVVCDPPSVIDEKKTVRFRRLESWIAARDCKNFVDKQLGRFLENSCLDSSSEEDTQGPLVVNPPAATGQEMPRVGCGEDEDLSNIEDCIEGNCRRVIAEKRQGVNNICSINNKYENTTIPVIICPEDQYTLEECRENARQHVSNLFNNFNKFLHRNVGAGYGVTLSREWPVLLTRRNQIWDRNDPPASEKAGENRTVSRYGAPGRDCANLCYDQIKKNNNRVAVINLVNDVYDAETNYVRNAGGGGGGGVIMNSWLITDEEQGGDGKDPNIFSWPHRNSDNVVKSYLDSTFAHEFLHSLTPSGEHCDHPRDCAEDYDPENFNILAEDSPWCSFCEKLQRHDCKTEFIDQCYFVNGDIPGRGDLMQLGTFEYSLTDPRLQIRNYQRDLIKNEPIFCPGKFKSR